MVDLEILARYPFLADARAYVRENEISTAELLTTPMYEYARKLGSRRIVNALESSEIADPGAVTESEQLMRLLSYPVARMLVTYFRDGFLIRRYALAEAKTMYESVLEDSDSMLSRIARELGLTADWHDDTVRLHFSDYIRYAPRDKRWKLVMVPLSDGYVALDRQKFARVVQEALRKKLEADFETMVLDKGLQKAIQEALPVELEAIRSSLELRKKSVQAQEFGSVDLGKLPPCMTKLLAMVQAGENLSHSGRFAITAFLHTIGMDTEEIMKLFGTSPDFNESMTRYQVEHITGKTSGTSYTPPECGTMKTYGICIDPDALCTSIRHPLSYYRKKPSSKKTTKKATPKEAQTKSPPKDPK